MDPKGGGIIEVPEGQNLERQQANAEAHDAIQPAEGAAVVITEASSIHEEEQQSLVVGNQGSPFIGGEEEEDDEDLRSVKCGGRSYHFRLSQKCARAMARQWMQRTKEWLLDVEMGFVWGTAGLSIIIFVFLAIWYIDPALLTLVLQFRQARCTTQDSAFLVGISNCSWTSCRLGCTREIYKCWQVQVAYEFVEGTEPYRPPWAPLSDRSFVSDGNSDASRNNGLTRLYPNVRGCGYPPELNCEKFYEDYGKKDREFSCWVSTLNPEIAMTELDLERAKEEVIWSLVPLFIFIIFVLYAFCRLGVFSICNPLKMCPKANDTQIEMPSLTPKKLFDYKKGLLAKKSQALASFQAAAYPPSAVGPSDISDGNAAGPPAASQAAAVTIPDTIEEEEAPSGRESASQKSRKRPGTGSTSSKKSGYEKKDHPRVFSASSLVSLINDQRAGAVVRKGSRRRSDESGSSSNLNDSFAHETLDLKEFDLDAEDIVSIRSMRGATAAASRAAVASAAVGSSGANGWNGVARRTSSGSSGNNNNQTWGSSEFMKSKDAASLSWGSNAFAKKDS